MKKRAQPTPYLKALGAHCKKLRTQRGLSIDRLAKEIDQLSSSVIHRLETGSGAVTVTALYRYAQALQIDVKALFDFSFSAERGKRKTLSPSDPRAEKEAFKTLLPVYSLKAAAGSFGQSMSADPIGWMEVKGHALSQDMFVAQAVGQSMEPRIHDGDYLVFRANPEGPRQGKIVLVQYRGPADPDTGGSYTIKVYSSVKRLDKNETEFRQQIVLNPLNPEYEPIHLSPEQDQDLQVVAEYLFHA
jgi:phage repressor protein C with HTH and peptisase S24 domain